MYLPYPIKDDGLKIYHAHTWRYTDITQHIFDIKHAGFNTIQLSPCTPTKDNGTEWWKLYQPTRFTIGNRLGTKEDLVKLVQESHKLGMYVIMDVVLRHTAGNNSGQLIPHENCDPELVNNKHIWMPFEKGDHRNRNDVVNKCFGMPSLNYHIHETQEIYFKFLDEILSICDGIRIDMAKHFALPMEHSNFWMNLLERYPDKIIYGECINLEDQYLREYDKLIGTLVEENTCNIYPNAIVFFESHDTYLEWKYTRKYNYWDCIHKWISLRNRYKNTIYFERPDTVSYYDIAKEINKK